MSSILLLIVALLNDQQVVKPELMLTINSLIHNITCFQTEPKYELPENNY